MQKIILDSNVLAKVGPLDSHVEVCDEQGRTLGYILPPDLHHELLYAWAKSQFSDEKIAAARDERKIRPGFTTAEAIARLERLTGPSAPQDPQNEGESRSGFERVLLVLPLAVVYEVYDDERIVYISEVNYSPRHG
jgi:hypothetical protein